MWYKEIDGDYIAAIGEGKNAQQIPADEYATIRAKIQTAPAAPSGYTYKLRADTLEWELVEMPPEPEPGEGDATAEDYEAALEELGVRV